MGSSHNLSSFTSDLNENPFFFTMPFTIVFLDGVGNVIVDTSENEAYWAQLEEAERRAQLVDSFGVSEGDSNVSIECVVFHILKGDRTFGVHIRLVVEALEALHLYDKDVLRRLMDHVAESFSTRQFADWEIMLQAQRAVEICLNQGKDVTEKHKGYSRVAPQWQWTFPQHYAAVA